jgi:hypothetical protein
MDPRRLRMRRAAVSLAILLVAAAWAGSPTPGMASCAGAATLEQSAQEAGVAVFTGHATRERPESGDVVFVVDRWFEGPHAGRVVHLLDSSASMVEPPTVGLIPATLAKTTSGEAISLVRDEPVLLVATWDSESETFVPTACSIAGVALDSPEGRTALAAAVALFGPGRPAVELPSTDALDPGATTTAATAGGASDWRAIVLLALGAGLVLVRRRIAV